MNAETLDEEPELYQFDSVKGDQFSFKAVHFRAPYLIAQNSDLAEIWTTLKQMRDQDLKRTKIELLPFLRGIEFKRGARTTIALCLVW